MESTRSPANQKRRMKIIKKLASYGTTAQPTNLSADQLILYLIQWLRLSKLISVELATPSLSIQEKNNYDNLQKQFNEKVQPHLSKYKTFLNNQEPTILNNYFSLKISEFLTLSREIRRTNPSLAGEILEQAEMFLRIYQSSIETHIFQVAEQQIQSNSDEVNQLISKFSTTSETSHSSNQNHNPNHNPRNNEPTTFFDTLGKNFQNTIHKVQIWGAMTWDQIQDSATEANREIRDNLRQSSENRQEQRQIRRDARDDLLFQKFSKLLAISPRILIQDMAWHLKITRRRLIDNLLHWHKKLDFR
ncbi:MAG: hypothetical protein E4G98_06270, partial [Promethearchaeota archaeon]